MGKFKFNEASVPATLEEGAIVIVDGVTYVGNSDDEPVLAKGYKEYTASITGTEIVELVNDLGLTPVVTEEDNSVRLTFSSDVHDDSDRIFTEIHTKVNGSNVYISPIAPTGRMQELSFILDDGSLRVFDISVSGWTTSDGDAWTYSSGKASLFVEYRISIKIYPS